MYINILSILIDSSCPKDELSIYHLKLNKQKSMFEFYTFHFKFKRRITGTVHPLRHFKIVKNNVILEKRMMNLSERK